MQRGGDGLCNFKSHDLEGLIEKVLFQKISERGGGSKCKDLKMEACLSF